MSGWIQLHRSIRDWEWFTDVNTSHLFMYCLLRANHKNTKWRGIDIQKGQFITSLDTISKETGLSVMQVRTAIKKLELTREITNQSTSINRLITITNYNKYQMDNKPNNKPLTKQQQTSNKAVTTDNNKNNNNNENNENKLNTIGDFESFWSAYGKIGNKQQALKSYNKAIKECVNNETIFRGLAKYQDYCRAIGQEQRYIKHASTWLNNRGWEDEYTITQQAGGQPKSKHQRAKEALGLA